MTIDEVQNFEKIETQLESLFQEMGTLAKKSQDGPVNKFKLKFVNQCITQANKILGKKYKPFGEFDQFDEEELPSNSDLTLILGQYLNCMENLRRDNVERDENIVNFNFVGYDWYWKGTKIKTKDPYKK